MVKKSFLALSTSLAFLISAPYAYAVSVTMEKVPHGDRIRISQTATDQNIKSMRIAPDALFIQVDDIANSPVQNPTNISGEFVNNIIYGNEGLSIGLGKSSFGFIQSKDPNGDILIDIYSDGLGDRWRATPSSTETYNRLESNHALPSQNILAKPEVTTPISSINEVNPQSNGQPTQGQTQRQAVTQSPSANMSVQTPVLTPSQTPNQTNNSSTIQTPVNTAPQQIAPQENVSVQTSVQPPVQTPVLTPSQTPNQTSNSSSLIIKALPSTLGSRPKRLLSTKYA